MRGSLSMFRHRFVTYSYWIHTFCFMAWDGWVCKCVCVIVSCRDLRCVAVCCSVVQCVAVCCRGSAQDRKTTCVLQCVAVCCSVLQCVAEEALKIARRLVCCSVLQCVAMCFRGSAQDRKTTFERVYML